jgi:putative ABC transport system permease protein
MSPELDPVVRCLMHDMRTTLRTLVRRPGFTLPAVTTLALGIAATTVIFSLAYGVLLSPLPYSNAKRLVLLWEYDRGAGSDAAENFGPIATVPAPDFVAWQRQTRTLDRLDALTYGFYSIRQGARPTEVIGGRVTPGFFATVGVQPLLGCTFAPGDPDDVVVFGYGLWQTQYGGDRSIVGRQVMLGDGKYTVLGVLPPQFFFYLRQFALWTPLVIRPNDRRSRPVMGVGTMRLGATISEAQAEFDTIASRLEHEFPVTNKNRGTEVIGLRAQYSRFFRPTLVVLLASVGFLLLIACVNVASLLLARATEREREMAIRAALGATRGQIIRELMAESLALALFAPALGVAIAFALVPLARTLLPMKLPIPLPGVEEIAVSPPVLLFSTAVSITTVLLFGLAPALRSASATVGMRTVSPGIAQSRFFDVIVIAELAVSVLLLTGAGLTLRSVYALYHDMGFRTDHVLTFRTPVGGNTPPQRLVRFYQDVIDRVRGLPGVLTIAAAYHTPGGGLSGLSSIFVEGGIIDPKNRVNAGVNVVSGEFFGALDIPIMLGRTFSEWDRAGSTNVAVISAGLARKLFPSTDPIGRRVRIDGQPTDRWLTVIGTVGDVRPLLSQSPGSMIYCPFAQDPPGAIGFIVKTVGPPLRLAQAVEGVVWQISRSQPMTYLGTLENDLDEQGFRERLSAIGLSWFAGFGLVLASVGMYGLIAYIVKQRVREFGVRLAIGATSNDIVALLLRRGAVLITIDLLLGIGAALGLTRLLKGMLYGVKPVDAPTFIGATALLALVSLAACYVPARKAGAVDPMTILRSE